MKEEPNVGRSPNLIRGACRSHFYDGLQTLADIANDKSEKSADRIRALDTLGRFGLGAADQAAVHIHAGDGGILLGVVRLPALDPIPTEVVEEEPNEGQTGPKLLGGG